MSEVCVTLSTEDHAQSGAVLFVRPDQGGDHMAPSLRCSLCERTLVKHCDHCAWWTCINRECDAHRYDLDRGILLHESGTVEQLGGAG